MGLIHGLTQRVMAAIVNVSMDAIYAGFCLFILLMMGRRIAGRK